MAEEDPLPTLSYDADVFSIIQGPEQDRFSTTGEIYSPTPKDAEYLGAEEVGM
ncbi:hypothetical protein Anapl_01288 [Anas platyrhynchos]|uniref:Uncharacterized protein n=1 Tax=Anas platyrhynchos TaxID=8839 RepID=R0LYG5_ANAPL|nr:hypothetical protein Anapl_01288 [Anas platyrhynchos]